MSKEPGFVVPSDEHYAPSAPPSYEEAMQQGSVAMPMPMPMPMPTPYVMPQPQPQPMINQTYMHRHVPPGIPSQPAPVRREPATIIVTTTVPLGRERCSMRCPVCESIIMTETIEEAHGMAHVCCCLLFFIGCCLCSCLPYCMNSCKTVKHKCPNCKADLGTYSPY